MFSLLNPALVLILPVSSSLYLSISTSLCRPSSALSLAPSPHLTSISAFHLDVSLQCRISLLAFLLTLSHTHFISIWFIFPLYLSDCPRNRSLHSPPLYPSLKHILLFFSPSLLHLHCHPFLLTDNLQLSGQHFALSRSLLSDHLIISGFSVEPPHRGSVDGSEWKSQNGSRKCQWLGPLGLMGPEWDREKDDAKQSWRDIIRADGHHLSIFSSVCLAPSL